MKLARTILLLVFLALFVLAQSSFIRFGPSTWTILNRDNMDKPFYRVGPFGWFAAAIYEAHDEYYYPTPNDYNPPGFFGLISSNAVGADFNCDGREDLLITWSIVPHTIERQSRATFTILLNEGDGRLRYAPEMFEGSGPPLRFMAYRTAVADFNGDGLPDIAAGCSGMVKRNPDGTYTMVLEPILLVQSTPEGKLRDASADIEGQETGGLPAGLTGSSHDLSAGDVNGDGEPDIYTGKLLFLNNGAGKFLNATDRLPEELRPDSTFIMTSSIGDLDGDGIGDIVAAYADGAPSNRSGYIMLSDGNTSLENRRLIELAPGRYGAGVTKFNYCIIMDVDQDGLNDIVFHVTRANPYYQGRTLQVLMNRGNGQFVDETGVRVVAPANLDTALGEATLYVVDVDRNGIKDLVLSAIGPWLERELHGITVYLNTGGMLRAMEHSVLSGAFPLLRALPGRV
ncbi:MAG: VCBS repeat-containing protein [Candidatus Aminicenantes bacterium]|nr:VCBS repeat-containing protein [Candidatus Aminicenantes bacterium]